MKIYRSEIDWWLIVLVIMPLLVTSIISVKENDYTVILILLLVIAFIAHVFSSVKYIINGDTLNVKCSVFINQKIRISEIKSVSKTNNPLSAPALSINRLEIKYGSNFNYVLISPKNRIEFVQQLIAINPNIDVKL